MLGISLVARGYSEARFDVEGVHRVEVVFYVFLNQLVFRNAGLAGPLDYLVVDIGEVLDVAHPVTLMFQIPTQRVKHHVAQRMAHVRRRIRRNAAHVQLHLVLVGWDEFLDLTG